MNKQRLILEKLVYAFLAGLMGTVGIGVFLINTLDVSVHNLGIYKHTLPFFKVFLIAATLGILTAIIFYIVESFLFNREKDIVLDPGDQQTPAIDVNQCPTNTDSVEPLSVEEAAKLHENHETKNEFEEDISKHTFEDPEVGIESPAKKLTETPASIFSQHNHNEEAQKKLDDQSDLPKLVMPPPAPPAPQPG